MNYKNLLFQKICDCEENATNEETYFEFIFNSYKYMNNEPLAGEEVDWLINEATSEEIEEIIDELDYLWEK